MSDPTRVVLASANPGKLREIREILRDRSVELVDLAALPAVSLPEEGDDYEGNAIGKARAVAEQLRCAALGDDSGLEVEALGGAPGPRSARYGGPGLDDAGRVRHLLRALSECGADGRPERRRARFVCVVALATPDGRCRTARGECEGTILEAPRGQGGFGYDPVFLVQGRKRTMAELSPDEKNAISHRARALRALLP